MRLAAGSESVVRDNRVEGRVGGSDITCVTYLYAVCCGDLLLRYRTIYVTSCGIDWRAR